MKKLYMFFVALAIVIVALSPAEAQRKNTTKHDREPINISESTEYMHKNKMMEDKKECKCEEIKKCCKHCKKMHKKEKHEHKKKHKKD